MNGWHLKQGRQCRAAADVATLYSSFGVAIHGSFYPHSLQEPNPNSMTSKDITGTDFLFNLSLLPCNRGIGLPSNLHLFLSPCLLPPCFQQPHSLHTLMRKAAGHNVSLQLLVQVLFSSSSPSTLCYIIYCPSLGQSLRQATFFVLSHFSYSSIYKTNTNDQYAQLGDISLSFTYFLSSS